MIRFFRKASAILTSAFFILSMAFPQPVLSAQLPSDAGLSKVPLQKKAEINVGSLLKGDKTGKITGEILKIAQKYYSLSAPKIESPMRNPFTRLIPFAPKFDGKLRDTRKAASLSNDAAASILSDETICFSTALACAAFSFDTGSNVVALNMGAAVYRFGLSGGSGPVNSAGSAKTPGKSNSMPSYAADTISVYCYAIALNPKNPDTFVNLGNTYMDLDRQEDARLLYEYALKLLPGYRRAKEGMAAYYLARGDKGKAGKELLTDQLMFASASAKVEEEGKKKLDNPKAAPDTTITDSAEKSMANAGTLSKIMPASTADFLQEIDPADAQQLRIKVNTLPKEDLLTLPKLDSIAHYSNYRHYIDDSDYVVELGAKLGDWFDDWKGEVERLLLKYEVFSDEEDPSENSSAGLSAGQSYENRLTDYLHWYNTTVLSKKTSAYLNYFNQTERKIKALVEGRRETAKARLEALEKQKNAEIEKISNSNVEDEIKDAQIEKVTIQIGLQKNEVRNGCFQDNYGMTIRKYQGEYRHMVEQYWADCMPHVRLLPEGPFRDFAYCSVATVALSAAEGFIEIVLDSTAVDYDYDYVDGSDLAEVTEELEQAYAARAEREWEESNHPSQFSPGALLDKLSWKSSWGPFSVTITANSIEVSGFLVAAGKLGYSWKSGKVSAGFGMGVQGGTGKGIMNVGMGAKAVTMITFNVDPGTGKISNLDWSASAGVSISTGAGTTDVGYTASVMQGCKFTTGVNQAYGNVNFKAVKTDYSVL